MSERLTIVVLPNPKRRKKTDLVLRTEAGMVVAFDSWQTLIRVMADTQAQDLPPVSVTVAERIGA